MAEEMILLWGPGSSPCWRIMIALEEKNLKDCRQKQLSFQNMDHKSQQVMDMNPRGQLPSFKHGDRILNESYAACMYLECQFKSQGNKLIPDCPNEQAQMFQRMFEGFSLSQKYVDVVYYDWKVPEGERHDSAVKRNKEALTTEVKLWESYMQKGNPFLAGNSFSLADVIIYPIFAYLFHFGLCKERYPKLATYISSLRERPSIKATWHSSFNEIPESDLLKDI